MNTTAISRYNVKAAGLSPRHQRLPHHIQCSEYGELRELCTKDQHNDALSAIQLMEKQEISISRGILHKVLQICTQKTDLAALRRVRSLMTSSGFIYVSCLRDQLIRLFGSCGSLTEANQVFYGIPKPTLFAWNTIISTHAKYGKAETVLEFLQKMDKAGVMPDSYIFSCALKACGSLNEILLGRWIHKQILSNELETDLVLGNSIIGMYAKCGSLDDAYKAFEQLSNRDAVSWGTMVAGYVQQGQCLRGFELFVKMQVNGLKPTQVTLLVALKACGGIEALDWGRIIHGQVVECMSESDVLIGSTLIDVYGKCGCLDDAHSVFEHLQSRNVVSWSAMMAGYAQHGQNFLALDLFERMQQAGVHASKVTFFCVLKACGNMEALEWGKLIHNQIIVSGLQVDMLVGSSLLDMYAKCGKLVEAQRTFEHLPKRDVVSWSAMIAGYSQQGQSMHALECFEKMQQQNIKSNKVTFLCSLKACGSAEALKQGQMIHDLVIKSNLELDSMVASSLIDMYGKCGSLEEALCLFRMMRSPDVVAWGAVISGLAQYEQGAAALDLFYKMQSKHIKPDKFVFSCTLKACGSIGAVLEGRLLHSEIICSGFDSDRVINNALIDMFAKCGSLREAREIFDNMSNHDAVTWGTMIAGYVQHGLGFSALELFESLCQTDLKPDKVIYVSILSACSEIQNIEQGKRIHKHILQSGIALEEVLGSSLLEMYVKCSDLNEARNVFNEWPKRGVLSWDVMIAGYIEHGLNDSALELFVKMLEEHLAPNKAIFSCILKACGNTGAIDRGRLVHNMIIKDHIEADVAIGSTLIDMYVKCGNLYEAHQVLNRLTNSNVVSWGALIAGYSEHGNFLMIRQCLQAMEQQGVKPNDTIFLIILTACNHSALLEDGLEFFKMMNDYGIMQSPEHYSCIIDLLGRAGCLEEANDILNGIPSLSSNVGRTSLLGNSKTHGNLQMGRYCFEELYSSTPIDASGYVLLSNLYADVHECNKLDRSQTSSNVGTSKKPGKAWNEVNNEMHEFIVVDTCDFQENSTNARFKHVKEVLNKGGYFPHVRSVLDLLPHNTTGDHLWTEQDAATDSFDSYQATGLVDTSLKCNEGRLQSAQ